MYVYIVKHIQSLRVHKFNHLLYHPIGIDPCRKNHYTVGNLGGIPGSIGIWRWYCWYSGTVLVAGISRVQNVRHRIVCEVIIKHIIKFEIHSFCFWYPLTIHLHRYTCNGAEQSTAPGSQTQQLAVRPAEGSWRISNTSSGQVSEKIGERTSKWTSLRTGEPVKEWANEWAEIKPSWYGSR